MTSLVTTAASRTIAEMARFRAPVAAWHATVGARTIDGIAKGDAVLVHGHLVRRFYRSGARARSLTEVVATAPARSDVS